MVINMYEFLRKMYLFEREAVSERDRRRRRKNIKLTPR